jgi:hypothetical protein
MDTTKVSRLCSLQEQLSNPTLYLDTMEPHKQSDEYGMGLCEAETTVDRVQWTLNSLNCSVSFMMLSFTRYPVLWFCDWVAAFEKPLGYSSIILMNSTWLRSVHTSHLITSSSVYGLYTLPHPVLPPLLSLQHGQVETFQVCKFAFHLVLNSILVLLLFS